ncbi:hypothetical protein UVI_02003200 [Ustilaginoidea virens]|nr:hypothetical protein UVI_02003200 [Ustilaginoidea virens]
MAAFGAAYEMEHAQSRELFEMAKKIVFFYLEERRKSDVGKIDLRCSTIPSDSASGQQQNLTRPSTPLWLVQAMLLNVIYGHTCSDKVTSDIASTHCTALVSLAESAGLLRRGQEDASGADAADVEMSSDSGRAACPADEQEQKEWLMWKSAEERKRTVYAIFVLSSLAVASFNHSPALTNSEICSDLPCDEEFFAAETSAAFAAKGGVEAAHHNCSSFSDSLDELLCANERRKKHRHHRHVQQQQQQQKFASHAAKASESPVTDLKPSAFGCLVLIYALHNYIWETRQRHQNRTWTRTEAEELLTRVEPALKAWQVAWSSNPQHSVERPNPFGMGPLPADALPLLDLAFVKLFVDLGPAKEKLWQRDWDGLIEELSRAGQGQDEVDGWSEGETGPDPLSHSALHLGFMDSPAAAQDYLGGGGMSVDKAFGSLHEANGTGRAVPSGERCLRMASLYAVDSLSMSDRLGVTFADRSSRELPMQTALCTAECAQVLAGWIAALQERVGPYLGVIGQDAIDFGQVPALVLLDEEDVKLLGKIKEMLSMAELKMNMRLAFGGGGGCVEGRESVLCPDGFEGYAAKILRLAAWMLDQSAVWPVAHVAARGLEMYASHVRARAEESVLGVAMTM